MNMHPALWSETPESVPLRNGFGEGLVEAARNDERVVGLCADLTESTRMEAFAKEFPRRFVQVGVAEQNLAAVASGMAAMGKVPFISSYAMFNPGRNWEQIRTTICYNNVPVKVVGSHAGVSVGADGGSHQALEDIAIMRVIPRMVVVAPCDTVEAKKATHALAAHDGPAYLRLAREKTPVMTLPETPFALGKGYEMHRSDAPKVLFVGCGPLLYETLKAARALEEKGIGSIVLNMHTIKPIDADTLTACARECSAVVTVEEHQLTGGLGGAVAEVLAARAPVPIEYVGVRDVFGQSGKPSELVAQYGLDMESIIDAATRVLSRKL